MVYIWFFSDLVMPSLYLWSKVLIIMGFYQNYFQIIFQNRKLVIPTVAQTQCVFTHTVHNIDT